MAWLEKRGKRFRVTFRYNGKKHQWPLKTDRAREEAALVGRLEENLRVLHPLREPSPSTTGSPIRITSVRHLRKA